MTAVLKIPIWMTVEEFLAWNPPGGQTWQLVDGEPQALAPANRTHGAIQNELGRLISNHLAERGSACTVVTTPGVIPHVQSDTNMRVPDLAVTCSGYENEETALTDPVLLVEILSPSNQAETWANVWAYTTIPSVQEILIVRTSVIGAELLRRNANGAWSKQPTTIESGDLTLESIHFRLPLTALYRTTRLARS
ncbi:MAG: Uma2 family endonuclease [Acidimicrobiales bacterium]